MPASLSTSVRMVTRAAKTSLGSCMCQCFPMDTTPRLFYSRPLMPGPLTGVRVLDVTTVVLGPWATQTLGDLGADVVKVEPPEGDTTRRLGPARHPGMAAFFLACNRNKRSLVLDLKQETGRSALLKLASTADVLLHNFRPEPPARLRLDH